MHQSGVTTFEIIDWQNVTKPVSQYPKGLTKFFVTSLLQLKKDESLLTVDDFWKQQLL